MCRHCVLAAIFCFASIASITAGESYRYTTPDGSVLFTDVRMSRGDLRRQKDAKLSVRTSYRGSYGRAPASGSCNGVDEQTLQDRYNRVKQFIDQAAAKANLDPLLVKAVARVESCFDVRAVSVAGARGVMQLMPATAKGLGVANSFDAKQNITAGSRYLASMLKRFDQNYELALAAYNAGPAAVERYDGLPPYPETRRYVPLVLSYYRRFSRAAIERPIDSRG